MSHVKRGRRDGNSHDLLRELVNSIMNFMCITLPRKVLPSTYLAS